MNPFDGLTVELPTHLKRSAKSTVLLHPFLHLMFQILTIHSIQLRSQCEPLCCCSTASVNPFDQASNVDSNKVSGEVGDKLKKIILPMVEFKNTPLAEALSQLAKMSVDFDTVKIEAKKGVRIFLETVRDASMPTISLNMKEIKLEDALSRVSEACGWTYEIHSGMIMFSKSESKKVINPFDTPPGKANTPQSLNPFDQAALETKFFEVTQGTINRMTGGAGGADDTGQEIKAFLEGVGIRFDDGKGHKFVFDGFQMIVTHDLRSLALIERILAKLD